MNRAGILVAVAAALTGLAAMLEAQPPPPVTTFITRYADGQYDDALRQAAAIGDLGPMRRQFVQDVPVWIAADPSQSYRRRAAAAAFLLEFTRARVEADSGRLSDLIEFTCVGLRTAGPPTAFELAWYRASMALAGRARAGRWLLGLFAVLPHQKLRTPPPVKVKIDDDSPKHLVHALERFPGDPLLLLAQIEAWTWGRDQEPVRNVPRRESSMMRLSQREAIVALERLADDPVVGPEALVRMALVDVTMGQHRAALEALQRAQQHDAAPAIRYLAFFHGGRVLEALGRPDDAIAQYVRALEAIPGAESATVALASLQFVHDDREAAVARIDQVLDRPVSEPDPGRLTGYGSFMHWPALRQAMRAELPK